MSKDLPVSVYSSTKSQAPILPVKVFNVAKMDYNVPEIILGADPGLLDSIHTHHPKAWSLYKTLKKLDWDELEFPFGQCAVEFSDPKRASLTDKMIKTLAWQWEADSVASRSIVGVLANVVTDSRIWTGYVRINDNENVHALTYSEIVRQGLPDTDPQTIVKQLMEVEEAQRRMVAVANVFQTAHKMSHDYANGYIPNDQVLYNAIFMYLVALFFLERIQFMGSFAITFAIGKSGNFQIISDAVRKIAQDEFEIHAEYGKEVLKAMLRTERGALAYQQCFEQIVDLGVEILDTETGFVQWMFEDGTELVGATPGKLISWNQFNCNFAFTFLGVRDAIMERHAETYKATFGVDLVMGSTNPLPWMQEYIDIAAVQGSAQEQDQPNYQVNLLDQQDEQETFDVDGI